MTLQSSLKRLVSVQEVAAYLDLSEHTVYKMASQRRIPYIKVGRTNRFDLRQIDAWLSRNTVRPLADLSAQPT